MASRTRSTKRHEAAGDQRGARAPGAHGPHQRAGARHEPDALAEHLVENR